MEELEKELERLRAERDAMEDLLAGQEYYQGLIDEERARVESLIRTNRKIGAELVRAQVEIERLRTTGSTVNKYSCKAGHYFYIPVYMPRPIMEVGDELTRMKCPVCDEKRISVHFDFEYSVHSSRYENLNE